MADKELPIQKWWPNYPNPVQMYLCWERGNTYRLVCNETEIAWSYPLNSDDHLQGTSRVDADRTASRPPPRYSVAINGKKNGAYSFGNNCSGSVVEIETNSDKPVVKLTQSDKEPSRREGSNKQEIKKMRPYKKRSFHSHLQSTENNMENENSEDSEKQASSSPPMEDVEKDKDKEGETKRRKRWKRKISRKQFRHHDIKLFTPGEYRTSTLLKQKESSPTVAKKPEGGSKESITELIVTTLGGQKQNAAHKKGQIEEAADSTTKNDAEENNNTNGIQNNNNIGKHNLPAIIMETPSVRRRSIDNTNIPKSNFKSVDHNFARRMSVDMPVLNVPENTVTQSQMTEIRQEQMRVRNNGSGHYLDEPTNVKNNVVETNSAEHNPDQEMQSRVITEQSYSRQNLKYNGGGEEHNSTDVLVELRSKQNVEPMEISMDDQPVEPENLSLKRRHSGETPVDLSRKSVESLRSYHPISHRNDDLDRTNVESNKNMEQSYRTSNYQHSNAVGSIRRLSPQSAYAEEYVKTHTSTSQLRHPITTYSREDESYDPDHPTSHTIVTETEIKITNLNMWQEVLQRLLKQTFTLQILDLMAHAYEQTERAKDDGRIPPELKLKAHKLLSETYIFISSKLKQLNLDASPDFVIKVLGQSENTPEKSTVKHYMENIERIRNLALVETSVPKLPTSQFALPKNYLQDYTELLRSPPSPYSTHMNQPPYHRSFRHTYPPANSSPKTGDHSSPAGHQRGPSPRAGGPLMSPGYSRGPSPKTGNHPVTGGYSRESSPRTGDHPMPMEPLPRTGDYSISQRRSGGPFPRHNEHPVASGLPQRTGDYSFTQGHPRGASPKADNPSLQFGHPREQLPRTREYQMPQENSSSPRTGDHHMLLEHPGGAFLRTGGELVQQGISRRPSPTEYASESSSSRPGNHYMATGFTEIPTARSSDHSMPRGYPRDLHLQHLDVFNMAYLPSNLNSNQFLTQTGHKEAITRSSGSAGRPRSKSHRNTDAKSGLLHHLKRSLSNPQHLAMENSLLLEGAISKMPPPRVPTSTHNVHSQLQPNNNLPTLIPNLDRHKELSITPSTATPAKPGVPSLYSEVFYQNLQNHVAKGNPLAISVHPQSRSYQKKVPSPLPNIHGLKISESQKKLSNVQKKIHEHHPQLKEPSKPVIASSVEEKITSSTDHLEISKVTTVLKQSGYEKVPLHDPVSPKPTETLKSIPVAVIVADKSMQITKEKTASSNEGKRKEASLDLPEESEARISVSSNSNENTSSSEENLRQAFDKEQEENNTEFLVWLEKLKSNEKLKSKFLSQMGIIKKEEPLFTAGSDPIEIVDSDEEESSEPQTDTQKSADDSLTTISDQTSEAPQASIKVEPTRANYSETSVSRESFTITTTATITSNSLEVNKVFSTPKLSDVIRDSSPKLSLSKKDFIPPIPLPYVPTSTGPTLGRPSVSIQGSKKAIYSPEIEPISPVANEQSFIFPDVAKGPKLVRPVNSSDSKAFPDSMTSPTHHKRKNPLGFPGYQSKEIASTETDNSVKRRKSLDRPEVTRSPRVAPSGKLCYVRESHMFLRYFDDTQVELFIRSLSTQDEELLRSTGIEPEQFKSTHQPSKFGLDQLTKTEIIYLPRGVEFSEKEDIPEVEEFIKETSLVEQFVPKDFADFYRYVTGFQIIKNKHPVSLQTFLTMYNTNRTSELLRKYLERDEGVSRKR